MVKERTYQNMQACLDQGPRAKQYHSDYFKIYYSLTYYPASHQMHKDKSETYSVEAVNADLRHYLRRLARRSRCFSRSLKALKHAIHIFVYCYNHRQLAKHKYPQYQYGLSDYVPTLF